MKKLICAMSLAVAVSATFTASAAPELVHRWSFNGDYNDSIGGTAATMIGSAVGFNDGNTAVVMSGAGNSTGSLNAHGCPRGDGGNVVYPQRHQELGSSL